jgi:hypothetical protein
VAKGNQFEQMLGETTLSSGKLQMGEEGGGTRLLDSSISSNSNNNTIANKFYFQINNTLVFIESLQNVEKEICEKF